MQTHAPARHALSAARHERFVPEPADRSARTRHLGAVLARVGPWWREPAPWGALLVLALVVIVVFQHPISRAIGTAPPAATTGAVTAPVAQPLPPTLPLESSATQPQRTVPGVLHPPRDPFRALVASSGAIRTPVTINLPRGFRKPPGRIVANPGPAVSIGPRSPTQHRHQQPAPTSSTTVAVGCSADGYQVRAGDSLWSISQRLLAGHHGYRSVALAWHALYAANQATVGPDPGYITVGEHLCLPSP